MATASETASPIKFGTDGWRAAIAEAYTFENVRIVAQATANFLKDRGQANSPFVVGYDMRFASEFFAAAVAEVLAANGIHVLLASEAAATPAVSYSILVHKAAGAGMITASHNPWTDNGYKYKPEYAGSADPATVSAIEKQAETVFAQHSVQRMDLQDAIDQGKVERFQVAPDYLRRLAEIVESGADSIVQVQGGHRSHVRGGHGLPSPPAIRRITPALGIEQLSKSVFWRSKSRAYCRQSGQVDGGSAGARGRRRPGARR